MRTSPGWIRTCHGLPQVTSRHQLGRHVRLGFSQHLCTVLMISPLSDVQFMCAWMRWKGDDDAVVLGLVPALVDSWIILCYHNKVLRHLFWANLALYHVGP